MTQSSSITSMKLNYSFRLLECRDTFSSPPCTLVQPSMQAFTGEDFHVPKFGIKLLTHLSNFDVLFFSPFTGCIICLIICFLLTARSFCPPIYPLGEQQWQLTEGTPLICLHALQIIPSPLPPSFASQTVIDCQPLMVCAGF